MSDNIFDNLPENSSIEEVINSFDFELVHSYMIINKWKVVGQRVNIENFDFDLHIPSTDELKKIAKRILEDTVNSSNNPTFVSTAGFTAFKWGDELSLYFSIESITSTLRYD